MKPLSIKSLLLVSALCTPLLYAQNDSAKVKDIERKVLRKQYLTAVQGLVVSAREAQAGDTASSPEKIGKRVQYLTLVANQMKAGGATPAANQEDLTESAGTLNDLAWSLVASPDAGRRHPDIAMKLTEIAIELAGENQNLKPKVLDTRSRALFLLGKRGEAIAGQEKAIAAATVPAEKAALEATLADYRKNELPEVSSLDPFPTESGPGAKPQEKGVAASGVYRITAKLKTIIIPRIEFENTTLEEAVAFLRKQSVELDTAEPDPSRRGLNIVVRPPSANEISRRIHKTKAQEIDTAIAGVESGLVWLRKKLADLPLEKEEERTDTTRDIETLQALLNAMNLKKAESAKSGLAPDATSGKASSVPADTTDLPRIKELRLRNVPLGTALKYICDQTRMRYKVDDLAITLVSASAYDQDIFTRTFQVPTNFPSLLNSGSPTARPIMELLKSSGIQFGEGSSAFLTPAGVLIVTNTATQLDRIEQIVFSSKSDAADQSKRAKEDRPGQSAPVPTPTPVPAEQGE